MPPQVRLVILIIVYAMLILPPAARILRRAGLSKWWILLVAISPVTIAGLPLAILGVWLFAYAQWPSVRQEQIMTLPKHGASLRDTPNRA